MNKDNLLKYIELVSLVILIFLFCSACSSHKYVSEDESAADISNITSLEKVDPDSFQQMELLEKKEQFDDLEMLASSVQSKVNLTDKQKGLTAYYLGRVYLEKNMGQDALFNARVSVKFLPEELKSKILLGITEVRWGNRPRGEGILNSLIGRYPASAEVSAGMGKINELLEQWTRARQWYERAVKSKPEDPRWHVKCALMFWQEGLFSESVTEFEKALALDSQDVSSWNDKGLVNLVLGREQAALHDFNMALSIDPYAGDVLLNRANYYVAKGNYAQALTDCNTGLSHNPEDSRLLTARGQIYMAQKKYLEANSSFEAAYSIDKNNPQILNELAWFNATCPLSNLRDSSRAINLAEKAIRHTKTPDPGMYDTLAAAYASAGDFSRAVKSENAAIELGKNVGLSKEILSDWHKRLLLYESGHPYIIY